jgi:hypothetical protein
MCAATSPLDISAPPDILLWKGALVCISPAFTEWQQIFNVVVHRAALFAKPSLLISRQLADPAQRPTATTPAVTTTALPAGFPPKLLEYPCMDRPTKVNKKVLYVKDAQSGMLKPLFTGNKCNFP